MSDDLWGDLPEADQTKKPADILREQAALLSQKTKNVVEGLVNQYQPDATVVGYDFYIRCPIMDNYSYHVLRLQHRILEIFPFTVTDAANNKNYHAGNEGEYRNILLKIFGSDTVRKVIAALRREANIISQGR